METNKRIFLSNNGGSGEMALFIDVLKPSQTCRESFFWGTVSLEINKQNLFILKEEAKFTYNSFKQQLFNLNETEMLHLWKPVIA